jgi:diguanylate cyclase
MKHALDRPDRPSASPADSGRTATDFIRWVETSPLPLEVLAPPPVASGLHDVTVMMVDDEPMMTDVIQTYLEDAGYGRFVAVNDPLLALEAARRHRPGLILLDLMMPGLSGFEILERMRGDEELRYVPVIVLTAASNAASKLRALELGATEFLSKPVDESELVLRVRNSLVFKVYQDRLANEDPLTGLPNRRIFVQRLRLGLQRERSGVLALLHINLDRFKQINDSLGQRAGDRLLAAVAERLASCTRREEGRAGRGRAEAPTLARLGGDEFALLLPDIEAPDVAGRVARRILGAMARPFALDGKELFVTPSIGISVHPHDGADDEALLRNAGVAMAHAKTSGRNTFEFYASELNQVSSQRLALETDLRRAIRRDELLLHYQPKVDLASGRVIGAEALLRWQHAELGLIPPDRFIPIAEESGLIVEIGEWVVHRACAQMAEWRDLPELKIAVNVSRHEMVAGGLVDAVQQAMQRHGIAAGRLVVELTESMLMDRVDFTTRQLKALRALGVDLSIDDFGTGYSSMSYLRRFPLDELKIDRSFVAGTPADKAGAAIVQTIIALGHSLGMRVVAEGVETEEQRALLHSLGCDTFQGYLCSRPLAPEAFAARVAEINGSR